MSPTLPQPAPSRARTLEAGKGWVRQTQRSPEGPRHLHRRHPNTQTPEGLGGGQPCSSSVGKWELLGQLREPRPASGDVPGPWTLRRWGARGPSAPGEMSSVELAKQGVGGLRTEPWV